MNIHILPEGLANMIAAGEVVERPASVVKELMENSIDAEATRIIIEVESGGKKMIKVSDNGLGMVPEDARLAFERHATSKIKNSEELEAIKTLGFRGEALPSIGSVAQVRLSTGSAESDVGLEIQFEGAKVIKTKEIARPRGTTVEVGRIFYNVPARKKFMKGDTTEASHITQVVTQQALAHPEIHFTLTHNGRNILDTLPTEQRLYRIAELFGSDLARELVQVNESSGDYLLEGYVSTPVYTRSSRNAQYCFVNRRYIRDKVLLHATQHGYSHLLPKGQHPALFLFIAMDPTLVDINVHPAKAEVRFAFQQDVHRFVSEGVRNALRNNEKPSSDSGGEVDFRSAARETLSHKPGPLENERHSHGPRGEYDKTQYREVAKGLEKLYEKPGLGSQSQTVLPGREQTLVYDQKPTPLSDIIYSDFEILGQLNNSFIILQGPRGLVVVDQHIAHERVLYERFRESCQNKKVEVQMLLFPVAVEFSPQEAQLLEKHLARLKELGLELEVFGQNGFLLRTVPAMLKNDDHAVLVREIVDTLPRGDNESVLNEKYEEIVIMMSCRNAIKINQSLQSDQIRKLLYDLEQTQMPYTCPHGRPIALQFPMEDILKKFLRK